MTPPHGSAQRRSALHGSLALALAATGCASPPSTPQASTRPVSPAPPPPARKPRVALALGGGAARGFAHVGVIEELERAGIRPDMIVGTSAGSLVGALYASGMPLAELRRAALSLEESALGDWTLRGKGVFRGKALQDLVNRLVAGRRIERFAMPFAAVTTDLYNGRAMVLDQGDAGIAVRASSAVPGVFEPVQIAGREYVDGGLCSPVPVRIARGRGADVVIAVDISAKPAFQETDTMVRVLLQTFAIMGEHLASAELKEANVVIRPALGGQSSADFSQRTAAMAEGARAAREALGAVTQAIAGWRPA